MRSLFNLLLFLISISGYTQSEVLFLDSSFKKENLNAFTSIINVENLEEAIYKQKNHDTVINKHHDFFYFPFENQYRFLFFQIENSEENERIIYLKFSNALIQDIVLYKKETTKYQKVYQTGIDHVFNSRPEYHRNFVFPITIGGRAKSDYVLRIKKDVGRPLVTSIEALEGSFFKRTSSREYWLMGLYFGLCSIALLFSLFVFVYLKNLLYLFYGLYVLTLSLYISSYLGLFYQFLVPENLVFNTYFNYVFFSELSLVLFILFSQRALNTETHTPKLKKVIEWLTVILISLRLLLHFVFTSAFENLVKVFMLFWYGFMIMATVIIIIQTVIYFRKDRSKGSLFALGLFFLEIGALGTLLYHSAGLFNIYWAGFPLLFYCSVLEVMFLTFFVVYMVKDIYDERNEMSKVIANQQKRILSSFIKGENEERQRIGKELHDNIGSQLTRLKLAIGGTDSKDALETSIDKICEDVRGLSHAIAPKELKLVSFVKAIEELSEDISSKLHIKVMVSNFDFPERLNSPYREELYRVIQEALNNIIKHAGATKTEIQLFKHGNELSISIEDNGKGFSYQQKQDGFGLNTMRTRVKNLHGTLSIDSRENKGTLILINIPYL